MHLTLALTSVKMEELNEKKINLMQEDMSMKQRYCMFISLLLCVKQSQNLNKFCIIWELQMIMQTFHEKNM